MASNFSKSDNAIADLHKTIWRIIVCHNLWDTDAPRISNNLVIFKHLYSLYFNLETSALSQMLLIKTDAKYQEVRKKKHTGQNSLIFHVSPYFQFMFFWNQCSAVTARTRGHHKARVTFEKVIWTFQPQTQNVLAVTKRNSFSDVSLLLLVPVLCLLDTVYSLS